MLLRGCSGRLSSWRSLGPPRRIAGRFVIIKSGNNVCRVRRRRPSNEGIRFDDGYLMDRMFITRINLIPLTGLSDMRKDGAQPAGRNALK